MALLALWMSCQLQRVFKIDKFAMERISTFWLGMMPVGKFVFLR
jgi:hypothetical protein